MSKISNTQLLLSAQRALLFNIIPSVRFIFIEIVEDKLTTWIYIEKEPNKDEIDIFHAVSGEISGDFPDLDDSKSEVRFFINDMNFENLTHLENLVYARYEGSVSNE